MGGILGGGKKEASPAPAPPAVDSDSVRREAEAERKRQQNAAGRASTMVTGGRGLLDQAASASKMLGS